MGGLQSILDTFVCVITLGIICNNNNGGSGPDPTPAPVTLSPVDCAPDGTDPIARCTTETIHLNVFDGSTDLLNPLDVDDGSLDQCGGLRYFVLPNAFDCVDRGTVQEVTLTVEDDVGLRSSCNAFVFLQDTGCCSPDEIPPNANCQSDDVTFDVMDGQSSNLDPDDIDDGNSDDLCGIVSRSVTPNSFTCADKGTTVTVTLEVEDGAGLTDSCTKDVQIVDGKCCNPDTKPPTARCTSSNVQFFARALGSDTIDPEQIDDNSFDECGTVGLGVVPNSFSCNEVGTTQTVVLSVYDGAGNFDTCTANVDVVNGGSC